jgi:alkylation response protein AidB-like acyl-CoA dehydrogenase
VHFAFTAEQEALRAEARRWLEERYPPERVAELADSETGWDPASWGQLAELGWLGVSVAEDEGGAGLGFLEEAVLFEELGRALYPGPYFSTIALALPGSRPKPAAVASGETRGPPRLTGWSRPASSTASSPQTGLSPPRGDPAHRGRDAEARPADDRRRRCAVRPSARPHGARARGGRDF